MQLETLMFWMEVFVAEWNRRKLKRLELQQKFSQQIHDINNKRKSEFEVNGVCIKVEGLKTRR